MRRRLWLAVGIAGAWLAGWGVPSARGQQLTPESPEVQAAIERGVHWLESADDSRLGAQALIGLVMLKRGLPASHPKVQAAAAAVQRQVQVGVEQLKRTDVYTLGLTTIFLVTLDPEQYRSEIVTLLRTLEAVQKPHGGFGYPEKPTGDTSMTQYVVLALWEAHEAGIDVPMAMAENVLDWLLRTQDPSGGFGYQGVVAPSATSLVAQETVRNSLSTAGLTSVYVCADLLGLSKRVRKKSTLPTALKEVRKPEAKPVSHMDTRLIEAAKSRGNQWMQSNFRIETPVYTHYYLYALERYGSFREAAEGSFARESNWYQQGAEYLLRTQQAQGYWLGTCAQIKDQPSVPDTTFSLLFLLRSMKKSIEHVRGYGPGLLIGGKGLPRGSAAVELRGGQMVAKPLTGPAQGLLAALENVDSHDFDEAVETLGELSPEAARTLVSQHGAKLRELLDSGHAEARLATVRALAQTEDLAHVPLLIYALNDGDATVALAARDALRRLSRRLDLAGMPDTFSEAERAEAIRQWKRWYLALEPDAEFEE